MSERLRHGGSVYAGLLVTIKRRVHRAWAENPSFLRRGSALFNSKVLIPLPRAQSGLPYFGKQSTRWGQIGCKPGFPG